MRIAVFYNLPFSGAKRTVAEHVKGLKEFGHIVDVYTLDQEKDIFSPGNHADNEYTYIYHQRKVNLPFLRKITEDLSDFYLLKKLHKRIACDIDNAKYDIVLVHTDKLTQAPFILKYLKTKNVYFCLEPLKIAYEYGLRLSDSSPLPNKLYELWNRGMRKAIDRENAQAANHTFAISYFGRELMIQAFDLYPKISYLGVDIKKFKKIKRKKKNQILFVGQKIEMNGYEIAQEAVSLIPKSKRPELKILSISKNKKDRLSDEEIVGLYNESLVTLTLSNFDTFGLVALESLSCEVPVIAFNVAGYRETMLQGETGYLVDFNAKEIADKFISLHDNPNLVKKMGRFGRKWVENEWTWDKQIRILEQHLRLIVDEK